MWIPKDYILVDILSGLPHLVGMFLAVWIVSQVLPNSLLAMYPNEVHILGCNLCSEICRKGP